MDKILLFAICYMLIVNLAGCAMVIEGAKGIAGVSTKSLEEKRKEAIVRTFDCDCDSCFDKTRKILKNIGAYIYALDKKKQMIAVYVSEEDTTPVGIFFKALDKAKTQVEVSSPSTYGKEFISSKLFSVLDKPLEHPEEERKSVSDGKKDTQNK